jgi:nitrogen fixation protein FixH
MYLKNLFDSLLIFRTGLVTRLVSAKNGLTIAARERLLMLFIFATFFEMILAMNLVFLWLLFRP